MKMLEKVKKSRINTKLNRNLPKDQVPEFLRDDIKTKPVPLRYAILGEGASLAQFISDMHQVIEENKKLHYLLDEKTNFSKKLDAKRTENNALLRENEKLLDTIARVIQQKNDTKREINRLSYNMIKIVTTGLCKLEGLEYDKLSDKDKHYWREFAVLEIEH